MRADAEVHRGRPALCPACQKGGAISEITYSADGSSWSCTRGHGGGHVAMCDRCGDHLAMQTYCGLKWCSPCLAEHMGGQT